MSGLLDASGRRHGRMDWTLARQRGSERCEPLGRLGLGVVVANSARMRPRCSSSPQDRGCCDQSHPSPPSVAGPTVGDGGQPRCGFGPCVGNYRGPGCLWLRRLQASQADSSVIDMQVPVLEERRRISTSHTRLLSRPLVPPPKVPGESLSRGPTRHTGPIPAHTGQRAVTRTHTMPRNGGGQVIRAPTVTAHTPLTPSRTTPQDPPAPALGPAAAVPVHPPLSAGQPTAPTAPPTADPPHHRTPALPCKPFRGDTHRRTWHPPTAIRRRPSQALAARFCGPHRTQRRMPAPQPPTPLTPADTRPHNACVNLDAPGRRSPRPTPSAHRRRHTAVHAGR
jgi:hypothetical protein